MPAGRPTAYNDEMLQKAAEYIDHGYVDQKDIIPSVVGMCGYLGVARATLYNWGDAHKEFLDILDACNEKQERILMSGGLSGEFNAAITKLALGKHGYSDKHEHAGDQNNPLVPVLNVTVSNQSPTES